MLKPQLHHATSKTLLVIPRHKPSISGESSAMAMHATFPAIMKPNSGKSLRKTQKSSLLRYKLPCNIKAIATSTSDEISTTFKAVVTVQNTLGAKLSLSRSAVEINELLGKTLVLDIVAAELDPKTGTEKQTIQGYAYRQSENDDEVIYECDLVIPENFGEVGAVMVENEHHKEMFVKKIVIDGFPNGTVNIACDSWVHSKSDNPEKRIFFTNKSYLPSQTPSGLKKLRDKELVTVRGDGTGERKKFERIYDYDVYNDIGNPDGNDDGVRPVLGGEEHPYPRRCRTGRPRSEEDPLSESRASSGASIYVPRDEAFSDVKNVSFAGNTVYSVLHAVAPALESLVVDAEMGFPNFPAIDDLFNVGFDIPTNQKGILGSTIPRLIKSVAEIGRDAILFETPEMIDRDRFSWFKDEEFARQTLAGLNPYSIRLVKEWPLTSKLDPEVYGPPESAITKELIEQEIGGYMTVEEAVAQKKLFILDYHDLLLPLVNTVNELKGTVLYASRTLFFLTPSGCLKPLTIELTRPPVDGKPQWKQVFCHTYDSTGSWLWKLAKAHVLAHDSGYHQLVSHWLRTHCSVEPYIIAANRQLSAVHPIFRLLNPYFRYTMEINALARGALINANGIIESSFSPGKYSMLLSSIAYDLEWQFDLQALPADLISRGMAEEDPTAPHGLKLAIEDYPFANDGLELWGIIKEWVTDYVSHYYPESSLVESDIELQAWWTEIRTVGHGDKKDAPGWPDLKTADDLIGILTTIMWTCSGHHAAVNFGQYFYAGYFPNRPTIARTKMLTDDVSEEEWQHFLEKPEEALLRCFPSQIQATKVMAILDVLSNHSPDEEYIGEAPEPYWVENPIINAAFERFSGRLKELEGIIDGRNADLNMRNRSGAGVLPYELIKPYSGPGVTGKGVPNSISI